MRESCIKINNESFFMNSRDKALLLFPEDFHIMRDFSTDCILLVLASELYDPKDYIFEPYL